MAEFEAGLLAALAQASETVHDHAAARAQLVEGVVEQVARGAAQPLSELFWRKLLSLRSDQAVAVRKAVAACVERGAKRDPRVLCFAHDALLSWVSDRNEVVQRRAILTV